jgi:hypothetical protein
VDIWDQAYTNQGALAVMALLLVLITMSVATFAQRISNRKIKATIDDLGARETIIANLSHSPTKSYFASLESVINQTDSPCSTAPIDGDEPNDAAVKASPPKKLVIVIDELVR